MSSNAHVPVLLGPVLDGLRIQEDGVYVDGTFGRGGHAGAILDALGTKGRLIAIDRDPDAIEAAPEALTSDPRFELVRGQCAQLQTIVEQRTAGRQVDGILLDLGVSSPQLDEASRGFSFLRDGPLDMRMDPDAGQSARDWLAEVSEKELKDVIRRYGDEPTRRAGQIARAITIARAKSPITTTKQLADVIVEWSYPRAQRRHPATKTFQGIRIFINDELGQLQAALTQSLDVLRAGGRLCVIAFHSLEDRIVKRFMREHSKESEQYRGMPNVPAEHRPPLTVVGKPIAATEAEIDANPRARSARLRIAERAA